MKIVIIVTLVFFVLTLAGTWLARRSAYSWADNERAMDPGAGSQRPEGASGASAPEASRARAGAAARPTASRSEPQRIVVRGFDDPKAE